MAEERKVDFLDYIILILKKKKFLLIYFFSIVIVSYAAIYFFVEEQFDSTALILAPEGDQLTGLSSFVKGLSGTPLSLSNINKKSSTDIYNTIIYSRNNLNNIINKFNLLADYKEKSWDDARKILSKNIFAIENDNSAYTITVRANSPKKSADMTNFIVDELNKTLINLNVEKSRNNRIFLGDRLSQIKSDLKLSEDSLRKFEDKNKILELGSQTKATIETYAKMESELAEKQVESSIMQKLYGTDAPNARNIKVEAEVFQDKLNKMKTGKDGSSLLLTLQNIPLQTTALYRLLRNVEINSKLLEFLVPLHEQAKFDEQKEMPIFQVIDYANPPEKRAYPHRTIASLVIGLGFSFLAILFILIKGIFGSSTNPKMNDLKKEFKLFKSK